MSFRSTEPLNVLHINQSDIACGGACIAAYRLHKGLLENGNNSRILVGKATVQDERIAEISLKPKIEKLLFQVTFRAGLNFVNLVSSFDLPNHPFYQSADIITFHNLHNGYFNYLAMPDLTKNKPAIWYLHDMWSFTGHCAYSFDCDRWQSGCGQCPYPETYPYIRRDATWLEWRLKKWVYERSNLTIVAPSRWLTHQARRSILNHFPIFHIPCGIDTDAYRPIDCSESRRKLGIPLDRKVIMCGALSFSDSRKGGDLLVKALQRLPASLKEEAILLTMGNCSELITQDVNIQSINLGFVSNELDKSIAFSSADVFLFPTRADNLPLMLQESMACGTPMVSFNIGGVPDLVRPNITGYLAAPEDVDDFCLGIVNLLEDSEARAQMSQNCREIAVKEYSLGIFINKFTELYRQALAR